MHMRMRGRGLLSAVRADWLFWRMLELGSVLIGERMKGAVCNLISKKPYSCNIIGKRKYITVVLF